MADTTRHRTALLHFRNADSGLTIARSSDLLSRICSPRRPKTFQVSLHYLSSQYLEQTANGQPSARRIRSRASNKSRGLLPTGSVPPLKRFVGRILAEAFGICATFPRGNLQTRRFSMREWAKQSPTAKAILCRRAMPSQAIQEVCYFLVNLYPVTSNRSCFAKSIKCFLPPCSFLLLEREQTENLLRRQP